MASPLSRVSSLSISLLRRSERYIKTDMVYLASGGLWLTLTQAAVVATGFLLSIAYANLMDPTEYGVFRYFLSIASILAIATLPGAPGAYSQAVARGHEGDLMALMKSKVRWGMLGAAFSFAIAAYYVTQGNMVLGTGFLLLGISLPFLDTFSLYDSLFQGRKRFDVGARYAIIEQVLASGAVFVTLLMHPDALTVLMVYLLAWTLARAVLLFFVYRTTPPNALTEPQTIPFAKQLTIIGVIPLIAAYLDRIIIFHAVGPVALAGFNFAIAIPDQMKSYFKSIQGLALPRLATASSADVKQTVRNKSLLIAAFLLASTIAYIVAAPLVFQFLFPKYVPFVVFSQVYALSVIFTGAVLPSLALQAQQAKGALYAFNVGRSLFLIAALVGFFFLWGIWGIIAARVLSDLFALLLGLFLVRRIQK